MNRVSQLPPVRVALRAAPDRPLPGGPSEIDGERELSNEGEFEMELDGDLPREVAAEFEARLPDQEGEWELEAD
jgi:hypothetical protein